MSTREWLYRSGDLWLPKPIVQALDTYIVGSNTSTFYLNYWHINHWLSGVLFGLFLRMYPLSNPFGVYILLHTLWEFWQLSIGMTPRNLRGALDILVDTTVGVLGLWIVLSV